MYYNKQGVDTLINNSTREDFLSTLNVYTDFAQEDKVEITSEEDLFVGGLPKLDESKFVYFNDWYYYAEKEPISVFEDIKFIECNYNAEEETPTIYLLDEDFLTIELKDYNYVDNMPFTKMEIILEIQAVETLAVNQFNSALPNN